VIEITMRDGKVVTGWRALVIAIPMLPVIAVYLLAAIVQVIGYTIMGKGKWTKTGGTWTWTRE
jgi:hypothetical protein